MGGMAVLDTISGVSLAWIATYLIHSTVLLGATWLVIRLGDVDERAQEVLWRAALIGGVMTATAQWVTHDDDTARHLAEIRVPVSSDAEPVLTSDNAIVRAHVSAEVVTSSDARPDVPNTDDSNSLTAGMMTPDGAWPGTPTATTAYSSDGRTADFRGESRRAAAHTYAMDVSADVAVGGESAMPDAGGRSGTSSYWHAAGLLIVAGGSAVWIAGLITFRRRVRRRPCTNQAWIDVLNEQRERFGYRRAVRLTVSDDTVVPMAMGIIRPEICLPSNADRALPGCEFRAALAHELAHLHRRDPHWLLLYRAARLLLFIQPLNRLAVRRLLEIAEFECDAWAARTTRDPLALARCLERVARQLVTGRFENFDVAHAPVASLAMTKSLLGRRVCRLLEPGARPSHGRQSRLALLIATIMVIAVTLHVPGVQARLVDSTHNVFPDAIAGDESSSDVRPTDIAATSVSTAERSPSSPERIPDDLRALLEADLRALRNELAQLHTEWHDTASQLEDTPDASKLHERFERLLTRLHERYETISSMVRRMHADHVSTPTEAIQRENTR